MFRKVISLTACFCLWACSDSQPPRDFQAIVVCSESRPGRVFDECLDPKWQYISAWQLMPGSENTVSYTKVDPSMLVNWDYVDVQGRGKVLEILYNDFHANGAFVMNSSEPGAHADMSEFSEGFIEFDVRLLAAVAPYPHLVVTIDCVYPCQSEATLLDELEFGQWQHVKIPLAPLVAKGLDITRISSALSVVPPWSQARGYRYQLDNIVWVAAPAQ